MKKPRLHERASDAAIKLWLVWLIVMIIGLIMGLSQCEMKVAGTETYIPVEIPEAKDHDYERIAITGWVRSVEQREGTLGSRYLEIRVVEGGDEITVFTTYPVYIANSRALFLGRYWAEGRFGGFLAENYLVAESVFKEWAK